MRLINIHTLELREFGEDRPHYAILSHRWSDDEVTYKDFVKGRRTDSTGYQKIVRFCEYVKQREKSYPGVHGTTKHELRWAWVDTCCIDKRSSAELSEAINSMYNWYEQARYCVAYLQDVRDLVPTQQETVKILRNSAWFGRGWTLQELLAPVRVIFCDSAWRRIGTTSDEDVLNAINDATGIETYYLNRQLRSYQYPRGACAAKKLSWAARRRTSRKEDEAYCLLGLMDVNMPLLYGEGGKKAFRRLQEEFIRRSDDESIFAWRVEGTKQRLSGILAWQPSCFGRAGSIESLPFVQRFRRPPYAITNKGLQIVAPVVQYKPLHDPEGSSLRYYCIPLNCREASSSNCTNERCVIYISETPAMEVAARLNYVPGDDEPYGAWRKDNTWHESFLGSKQVREGEREFLIHLDY